MKRTRIKTINLRIAKLGKIEEIAVAPGSTVKDVLAQSQLRVGKGEEVRMNGRKVSPNQEVKEGDTLFILGRIEGGDNDDYFWGYR